MDVNVHFPEEMEQPLLHRAAAAGLDVPAFVQEAVAKILGEEPAPQRRRLPHDEFMEIIHKIVALHPVTNGVDDSRETIYAGRGVCPF